MGSEQHHVDAGMGGEAVEGHGRHLVGKRIGSMQLWSYGVDGGIMDVEKRRQNEKWGLGKYHMS